jgi:hypothetical protein
MTDRKHNFTRQWLARARITDNPEGDLIADMRADPDIPPLFHNIDEMRGYLARKGACIPAMEAVRKVWPRYRRSVDRQIMGPTHTDAFDDIEEWDE